MQNALNYSHFLLQETIERFPEGHFIDATLGNGYDSYFILNQSSFQGRLYAFDIQSQAIENSRQRFEKLPKERLDRIQIFQESHDTIESRLENVPHFHGAIYNLGYLPGGDHSITTQAETTLTSLEQVATKLVPQGRILLVVYSGHPAGQIEKDQLLNNLQSWPQEHFQILQYQFINQDNQPPMLLVIERLP